MVDFDEMLRRDLELRMARKLMMIHWFKGKTFLFSSFDQRAGVDEDHSLLM